MTDEQFSTLDRAQISMEDYELALRHAPRIRFDEREPFLPSVVGYTVFREALDSPSFPRRLTLPDDAICGIEYAVWWDWDIQHLYELEHIWVYLNAAQQVVVAEASWHGGQNPMVDASGVVPVEDGRVILFSEPGKHAFAPTQAWLTERMDQTRAACSKHAGKSGVLVTSLFEGVIESRTPLSNQLVWTYLERRAFEPTFNFSRVFDLAQVPHVPWDNLYRWIPARLAWCVEILGQQIPPHERRVIRIAHRGASAYAQENSPAAIQKAAEMGADMVEVDVRLSADRVPVISHDEAMKRVFGVEGSIGDYRLEELLALTPEGLEPIMTLDDLARLCRSINMGLYLDIKQIDEVSGQTMLESLRQQGMLWGTIFGSFRADFLAEIKALEPHAQTSVLFSSTHVDPVLLARAIGCNYVHPCWERFDQPQKLLSEEWMSAVLAANLGVVCWHEERPEVIHDLQTIGVNGICSDEPELLLPG